MGMRMNNKCALAIAVLMVAGCGGDEGSTYTPPSGPGTGGMNGTGTGGADTGTGGGGAGNTGTGSTGGTGGTVDIGTICENAGPAKDGMCKEKAEGVYALKVNIDVYWDRGAVVDAGRGDIEMTLIGEISDICQDGSGGLGLIRACGAKLPTFLSDVTCDAYETTFPDDVWATEKWNSKTADGSGMPSFTTTGKTTGFDPGSILTLNAATGLLGVALTDENGAWPATTYTPLFFESNFMCPDFDGTNAATCFPDHDKDGQPGVTVTINDSGDLYNAAYPCTGGDMTFHLRGSPVNLLDGTVGGGGSGAGARATRLAIGTRVNVGGSGEISSDCNSGTGVGESAFVDSRAIGCFKRADQMPGTAASTACDITEVDFVDTSLPVFIPLDPGAKPPASITYPNMLSLGDGPASPGARSSVVRLGDLTTAGEFGGFDCAAARGAAFPAF